MPIFTKVKDEAPTLYSDDCKVTDAIVSDGCRISGNVTESILFRGVAVSKNCTIKNCVIMQDVHISDNCYLENVILDKNSVVRPGIKLVFTYQGDGDLASIGTAEIVHAAARGEKICTFFVNNAVYGMTSGQMAPTTLLGQVTTTSPLGRDAETRGYPINVSEMLSTLTGAVYIERVALFDYKHIQEAKKAIAKAFRVQQAGLGFAMVEFLSTCPTNWGKEPIEALEWCKEKMVPQYPLGVFKGKDLEV